MAFTGPCSSSVTVSTDPNKKADEASKTHRTESSQKCQVGWKIKSKWTNHKENREKTPRETIHF